MKNILEEIHSRLEEAEEQIRDLANRIVKITQSEQQISKKINNSKRPLQQDQELVAFTL